VNVPTMRDSVPIKNNRLNMLYIRPPHETKVKQAGQANPRGAEKKSLAMGTFSLARLKTGPALSKHIVKLDYSVTG
jgi:hypothetical protein